MRISIHTNAIDPIEVDAVSLSEQLLIGRDPDSSRLGSSFAEASATPRELRVGAPSVSANHVLLSRRGAEVNVVDLGSRNGTWLQLPPSTAVSMRAPESVALFLAPTTVDVARNLMPDDARWRAPADYERAVADAVENWLKRHDSPARVEIVPRAEPVETSDPGRLPLGADTELRVVALRTVNAEWLSMLTQVARFVSRQRTIFEAEQALRDEGLIVASPAMRKTLKQVIEAAERGVRALLLIGPSGSGKEGLARAFHRHTRRAGPFVAVNCAGFGRELVRAELFGAEKGAFTGCVQRIVGAVETADEGTLFLDEIGDLPSEVQPVLLRFLERGEYQRLGRYGATLHSDVRIVSATNRDLRAASLKGEFRSDLWFRLSIEVVELPSLNERFEDVEAYLRSRRLANGASLFDVFTGDAVEILRTHVWAGHFRELINFAQRFPANVQAIDADACRDALARGSLHPVAPVPRPTPAGSLGEQQWSTLAERASQAFAEDHDGRLPHSWDEVKDFGENYLKPLLFAHLSGAHRQTGLTAVDINDAARRLTADRGTAAKQLQRYFDRFGRE